MKIRITKPDGPSWYSSHVGEEFDVEHVTVWPLGAGFVSFQVSLVGRHEDTIAGSVGWEWCEVTDWTGWPFGEANT